MAIIELCEIDPPMAAELLASGRAEDLDELSCFGSQDTFRQLMLQPEAQAALVDGIPACAWGIVPDLGFNRIWLWTTPLIEKHRVAFVRYSIRVLLHYLRTYGAIGGYVRVQNRRSVNWLERLGFRLGPAFDMPPAGLVRRFEKWL